MLLLLSDGAPDVRSLFRRSEPGGAWDPYDFSHQFQDSTGTIPVTAAGDPVGLTLDKSRGGLNNLGAECWVNSTPTIGNNAGSVGVYNLGSRTMTNSGSTASGFPRFFFTLPGMVIGRHYLVSGRLTGNLDQITAAVGVRLAVGGSANSIPYNTTTGVFYGIAVAAVAGIEFVTELNGAESLTIDSLSIREIPGVHRYQTASGSRKLLARIPEGGRRNLLVQSEDLSSASWGKTSVTISGTDTINCSAGSASKFVNQSYSGSAPSTISFDAKAGTHRYIQVLSTADPQHFVNIDLTDGVIGTAGSKAEGAVLEDLGGGWRRYRVTITNTGFTQIRFYAGNSTSDAYGVSTTSTGTWQLKRIQLETGSSATAYQRVGVNADCTEAGKRDCWGWLYDGLDDSDLTSSVDFAGWTGLETRKNLISGSDHFGPPWGIDVLSPSFGQAGPEGRNNAMTFSSIIGAGGPSHNQTINYTPNQPYVLTFWLKAGTTNSAAVGMYANAAFLSQTGTVLSGPGGISGTGIQNIGSLSVSEWTKFQITFTAPASGTLSLFFYGETAGVKTGKTLSVAQFQIEPGSTPTAYQPTGTDKLTVLAAVRKNSDAAAGAFVELSATTSSNTGSFHIYGPRANNEASYGITLNGFGGIPIRSYTSLAAPRIDVLALAATTNAANSAAAIALRLNGAALSGTEVVAGAPSGNFGNYPLFFGRRNNNTAPFNGYEFGSIVRGAATAEATVRSFERNWLAYRAGISF